MAVRNVGVCITDPKQVAFIERMEANLAARDAVIANMTDAERAAYEEEQFQRLRAANVRIGQEAEEIRRGQKDVAARLRAQGLTFWG